MMPIHSMDMEGACHRYSRDIDVTHKNEVSDTEIWSSRSICVTLEVFDSLSYHYIKELF